MDEGPFLKAICEHPDDDGPRLVYADWLDERGDARGEFIRVQCQLTRLRNNDPARPELQEREGYLLSVARCGEWDEPLRALGASPSHYKRGFPTVVAMPAEDFLRHGEEVLRHAPRPTAYLTGLGSGDTAQLARSPLLAGLRGLGIEHEGITEADAQAIAMSPHLRQLTRLTLPNNNIRDDGARALAASPHLERLRELDLWDNDIGPAGAHALAASPHLAQLTRLNLGDNWIGPAGARALAASPHLARLTRLNLDNNGIGDDGARALAASPHLARLTRLDLDANGIGDDGARNNIGPSSLRALAESPHFRPDMRISVNGFTGRFDEFQSWERIRRRLGPERGGGRAL